MTASERSGWLQKGTLARWGFLPPGPWGFLGGLQRLVDRRDLRCLRGLHFLNGAGELKASRRPAVAGIGQMVERG
jgi:hypothetical protein